MMNLKPFFRTFSANLMSDDVINGSRSELSLRALNVVDVLREDKEPEMLLRASLVELMNNWQPTNVRSLLSPSDDFWFDSTEREALLRALLNEIIYELKAS